MIPDRLITASSFRPGSLDLSNGWVGHLPFAAWVIQEISPKILVELGTQHSGNSFFAFCQAVVEAGLSTKCYAVDTWKDDDHTGEYTDEIFTKVDAHHREKYAGFSRLLRMNFDDAVTYFADESIDILHIGGPHTYEAVRHDFEIWLPKVAPGGIVLFHDTAVRECGFGVWRLWQELCQKYPAHLEFTHSSGLGVLQVGVTLDDALPWLRLGSVDMQAVRDYFRSLDDSMLERYRAREQTARVLVLEAEVDAHKAKESKQDASIAQFKNELEVAVSQISAMRASVSWRLTAPLRFAGHIARGNFAFAGQLLRNLLYRVAAQLPPPLALRIRRLSDFALNITGIRLNSSANHPAIAALVSERCDGTRLLSIDDPMCAQKPSVWPAIDVCVVTYNSRRWIDDFIDSLLALDYPKGCLAIHFVDNNSTDDTEAALRGAASRLQAVGFSVDVQSKPNKGFGAGHNAAIRAGKAPFCLVTNIDLTFEPDSLRRVVAMAVKDVNQAAAWELRQKPFEHPKFYDPVTGSTNWNAHACVLLRRSAVEAIGGYDETLFMYCEDVELSFRLRRAGHLLRYCPAAVVWHFSYESDGQVKPLQYSGSTFGNLYLRLKFGKLTDIVVLPLLAIRLLLAPEAYPGSRRHVAKNLLKLIAVAPKTLMARRSSGAHFPFRNWEYELTREGAFIKQLPLPVEQPLVSIITRTYQGRELYLRQALLSGAHQTWPNVEFIVVEDGGDTMRELCDEVERASGRTIRFIANGKHGRSKAGNVGLAAARGRWCVFLDDDDLLFADHVEVLVNALLAVPEAVASYAPAWEVVTDTTNLAQGSYIETNYQLLPVLCQDFDFEALLHHNCFAIQSVLFERQLFIDRGGFDEDMDALEDWMLWIRYAWNHRFVYVPKVTSMYRVPADPVKAQERDAAFSKSYPLAVARSQAFISTQTQGKASRHSAHKD
jgi:GT2 family glycosyltransferase